MSSFQLNFFTDCTLFINVENKIEDVQLAIPLSNETVTKEDGTCLLCLQIPKEWYHIGVCGCQFCRQVNITLNLVSVNRWCIFFYSSAVYGRVCTLQCHEW